MANQYPLPSGYPPPGATYGMNQSPPVVPVETTQQIPAAYHQPPWGAINLGPPLDTGMAAAQVSYSPPVQHPHPESNYSPMVDPQVPQASYSPAYIPSDGMQGESALPYGMQPPGMTAQRVQEVNSKPHEYDDPILRAEMEGIAASQAAAAAAIKPAPARESVREAVAEVKAPVAAAVDKRPFFLVSENNEKCVLDVFKDNPKPGATVGIYKKKTPAAPNQLWYIGADGLLRSKLNDLVIAAKGNNKDVHTAELTGDVRQQWIVDGNKIVNKMFTNECLTVKKGLVRVKDDAEVTASNYEGKPTQHWKQVYADE